MLCWIVIVFVCIFVFVWDVIFVFVVFFFVYCGLCVCGKVWVRCFVWLFWGWDVARATNAFVYNVNFMMMCCVFVFVCVFGVIWVLRCLFFVLLFCVFDVFVKYRYRFVRVFDLYLYKVRFVVRVFRVCCWCFIYVLLCVVVV